MKKLVWVSSFSYLLNGLAHVVVGALLVKLMEHYGNVYRDGGMLIFLQFAGFLFGVLTTPAWTKRLGRRGALVLATLSLFAAETVYTLLPAWHWMLLAAPFAGLGFGMVEAIIGALIIDAAENNKGVAMSRLEVFFGLGALLMPLAAGFLLLTDYWQVGFMMVGLLSLALAVCWGRLSYGARIDAIIGRQPVPPQSGKPTPRSGSRTATAAATAGGGASGIVALFVLFFLLYVGVEMSFSNFVPSMQIEQYGMTDAASAFSVMLFWLTMAVGRMYAGNVAEKIGYARYLVWTGIGTVLALALFSVATAAWLSYAAIGLLGLLMSGTFSIALVYVNHLVAGDTERTTSFVIAAGGVGGALLPLGSGWLMDHYGVFATVAVLLAFAAFMPAIVAVSRKRAESRVTGRMLAGADDGVK